MRGNLRSYQGLVGPHRRDLVVIVGLKAGVNVETRQEHHGPVPMSSMSFPMSFHVLQFGYRCQECRFDPEAFHGRGDPNGQTNNGPLCGVDRLRAAPNRWPQPSGQCLPRGNRSPVTDHWSFSSGGKHLSRRKEAAADLDSPWKKDGKRSSAGFFHN